MKAGSDFADSRRRGGKLDFPAGKRFAFTILDDTDDATVSNVKPLYMLLHQLGLRTTKTAWPLDCPEGSRNFFAAQTLQDGEYLEFVKELLTLGFEFASHGATMESSRRERTLEGLRFLEEELGVRPVVHCNHGQNAENLYWGADRYRTLALRLPLRLVYRVLKRQRYSGHKPGSPYFWGDIAKERFRFVRNFAFAEVNTASFPPVGPYRLRSTPYVNYWFNTSDAPDVDAFKRLLTEGAIDRLEAEGGVCILSTHLGKGFVRNGRVDEDVQRILEHLAARPGWFAPVSEILEHLLPPDGAAVLPTVRRWSLEVRHFADRIRHK